MEREDYFRSLALLVARAGLGGSIAAHGAQKLFGAFGGPGIEKTGKFFESLGFADGERYARAASATELTSGALIAFGALNPLGPAMLLSVMAVAVETVHRPKGYFMDGGGYEMNVMYALLALLLATQGQGAFSIDSLLGLDKRLGALHGWFAMLGGFGAALAILSQRQKEQPPSASANGAVREEQPTPA